MKKLLAVAVALMFVIGTASAGFAAKENCKVTAADGKTVTFACEKEGVFKEKDKLKVPKPDSKAKVKCEVTAVDGVNFTATCEEEGAFKVEDEVKLSPPGKGAAVEGC